MKNHLGLILLALASCAFSLSSCELQSGSTSDGATIGAAFSAGDPTAAATATATGTTNTTLTELALVGTWKSTCLPFTPTFGGSGTTHRNYILTISTNPTYYNLDEQWWANGTCTSWVMQIGSGGTFSIGSLISGSLYNVQFLPHNGTFLYPIGAGAATWLTATGSGGGNGCPNAGPYTTGQPTTVGAIGCNFSQMVALGSVVNNVVKLTGSTLSFGAESVDQSSLGVPANETTPATTSIDFTLQ